MYETYMIQFNKTKLQKKTDMPKVNRIAKIIYFLQKTIGNKNFLYRGEDEHHCNSDTKLNNYNYLIMNQKFEKLKKYIQKNFRKFRKF